MSLSLFEIILKQEQGKSKTVKQQRIVESAIKLFAERGYSNTSTAEIAKDAEVSEGTIFKHYGTKENLLLSVIVPFLKDFASSHAGEVLDEIFSKDLSFRQIIKAFFSNRVEFLKENQEIFQVLIKEIFYRDELKKELLPFLYEKISPFYVKVIEEYKERGELEQRPNEEIIHLSLLSFSSFFISRFVIFDTYEVTEADIDCFVDYMMNGLSVKKVH